MVQSNKGGLARTRLRRRRTDIEGLKPAASRRVSTLAVRRVWLSPLQIVPFADCEEMGMDVGKRKRCHKFTKTTYRLANTRFLPLVMLE